MISVSTKELKRTPLLKHVDFSHNSIEFVDGYAFPANMTELAKIILLNNHISRVYKNAFSNLLKLNHLDLSRNKLTSISRKILHSRDISLNTIDLRKGFGLQLHVELDYQPFEQIY
ncbi:decorin-like [Stegodyphus dumicola]|uniref:decorin-like n=1 Tax=Stegodyphus dumicola TaxID=202533 RepID=UPI0015AFA1E7|nr:decorin-like [Stegodyphus dumicola]